MADLQRFDPRPFHFRRLIFRQPFAAQRCRIAKLVQLVMVARPDHAAILQIERGFINDGRID